MENMSGEGVHLTDNNMMLQGDMSDDLEMEEGEDPSGNDNIAESTGLGPSEPFIGMEFISADHGKEYYCGYARHNGFTVRVNRKRRSRVDHTVIGFDYVCSKEGYRPKRCLGEDKMILLSKQSRVGCKAILVIAYRREIEKWVVTNFSKEHNHDLLGFSELLDRRKSADKAFAEDDKDKRIRELTLKLCNERQRFQRRCSAYEERCAAYKLQLCEIIKDVELHNEQLTDRVPTILEIVEELEDEFEDLENHHLD